MERALYRKYRPVSLEQVLGQEQVVKSLQHSLAAGNFSHAYLFTGPRGCGKTSVARIFAHAVNGFPYTIEDSYVDIVEIDAASNTGVDNIRDLREKAVIAPTEGKYKVYIIDEVHMLSKSAFNALLKTLEEPPAHVIFIMATTDAYKVPATIMSRVQVFEFSLASTEVMLPHLQEIAKKEGIKITSGALGVIAERGGGSFRDTISLLDQISTLKDGEITEEDVAAALGLPVATEVAELLREASAVAVSDTAATLKRILDKGIKPETVAGELISQIMAHPTPGGLRLLQRLPEVREPYAGAKLLYALLAEASAVGSSGGTGVNRGATGAADSADPDNSVADNDGTEVAGSATHLTTLAPQGAVETRGQRAVGVGCPPPAGPMARDRRKVGAQSQSPQEDQPATEGATPPQSSSTITWEDYLEKVKGSSSSVYNILQKSTARTEGQHFIVSPAKKVFKSILESPNNRAILDKHLPEGYSLSLADAEAGENLQDLAAKDPHIAQISGIMGNIQEVKSGDSPF